MFDFMLIIDLVEIADLRIQAVYLL